MGGVEIRGISYFVTVRLLLSDKISAVISFREQVRSFRCGINGEFMLPGLCWHAVRSLSFFCVCL